MKSWEKFFSTNVLNNLSAVNVQRIDYSCPCCQGGQSNWCLVSFHVNPISCKTNVTQLYLSVNVSFTACIGFGFLQVSLGYFMADLAMIFWFYPSLGGLEYVSSFCLKLCFLSFPLHACSFITDEQQSDPLLRYVWYHHSSILYIFFRSLIDPDC